MSAKSAIQLDLFRPTHQQAFDNWAHTPEGGQALDKCILLALACQRRGLKVGMKAIWERVRWHFDTVRRQGEAYALNNVYTAYAARFIMARVPELAGYFDVREVGRRAVRKAVVIPIREVAAVANASKA